MRQIGPTKGRTGKFGNAQIHTGHIGIEFAFFKIGAFDNRPHQADLFQPGSDKLGVGEPGQIKIGFEDVSFLKISPCQIGTRKIGLNQLGSNEFCPAQISIAKISIFEAAIGQIGTAQIGTG